ncbi:hypothetical protein [Lysobacter sp. ESA13C]|uniref:hypothetical protein n=1 Tax=Lysobacter sp. ESA13C TaxID=2862676 RepID=UPI001CBB2E47|nr:hypothetical protein [Lysobacter sp. ESA13C]
MNIYKNLMFLHGHFVDPRDADDDVAETAAAAVVERSRQVVARRSATAAVAGWRAWFARTPESLTRQDACRDAHGCA